MPPAGFEPFNPSKPTPYTAQPLGSAFPSIILANTSILSVAASVYTPEPCLATVTLCWLIEMLRRIKIWAETSKSQVPSSPPPLEHPSVATVWTCTHMAVRRSASCNSSSSVSVPNYVIIIQLSNE
jgi:hypothetical protein